MCWACMTIWASILKFQRAVRDAELERRHRKETDPWDAELSQTPPLPKDWERWVNKVGIQENTSSMITARAGQGTATALIVKRKSH